MYSHSAGNCKEKRKPANRRLKKTLRSGRLTPVRRALVTIMRIRYFKSMDDLYAVLGVPRNASADEIKRAYREAAFKYHPDRNPGNTTAEEQFKKINAAYAVLGDEKKRAEYDRGGYADPFAAQQSNPYQGYGQYEADADPFEAWFGTGNSYGQRRYTYTYNTNGWRQQQDERDTPVYTKRDATMLFIKSVLLFFLGTLLLRLFWFIIPFGPLIAISVIINGAVGAIRAVQAFFKTKPKQ